MLLHGFRAIRILLATATDLIEMSERVGGIFVNPRGPRALKFLLSEAAGQ